MNSVKMTTFAVLAGLSIGAQALVISDFEAAFAGLGGVPTVTAALRVARSRMVQTR